MLKSDSLEKNVVETVPNLLWLTMGCWLVLLGLLVLLVRRRLRQQRGPASGWRPDWRPDWRPLAADGVAGRWVLAAAVEEVGVLLRLLLRLGAAPPAFSSSGVAKFRSCGTFGALKWGKGRCQAAGRTDRHRQGQTNRQTDRQTSGWKHVISSVVTI